MWPARRDDALSERTSPAEDRADVVLACARLLHVNGQSTEDTIAAAGRLGRALGLSTTIIPGWGELKLQVQDGASRFAGVVTGDPVGVDMARVALAMRAIDDVIEGRLTASATAAVIRSISHVPPAPAWLFTIAAGA